MMPHWAKSLLVKIFIGLFLIVLYVQCVNASGIDVTTPTSVSFSFGPSAEATKMSSFRITNSGSNATTINNIVWSSPSGSYITIMPSETNFNLDAGEFRDIYLTINVDPAKTPEKEDPPYSCTITVNSNEGTKSVDLEVTVIYNAKIEVSPSSIDFGVVHRTDNPSSGPVTISEVYGYKTVDITSGITGNSWLKATLTGYTVKKGSPVTLTFQLTPGYPDRNEYSWTFSLSTTTSHTEISPSSIHIEVYILLPPKLGTLYDEELELKFDKPKGAVSTYTRYIDVGVRNEGDETLYFTGKFTAYSSGISIRIVNPSGAVSGKSSEDLELQIVAPYDAPEGTYRGKVDITAGEAGSGSVDITIVIKWPVDFSISPSAINFGPLELKELEYEKREVIITLTELYLYKPVRNLRLSKSGEYGNWLKEERDFAEISPGESGNITIKLEPGLEAVPKDYLWMYALSASEIGAKRMDVRAKIVPLNITEMMEGFRSFRGTPLYTKYPSSESIILKGIEMLEVIESSEIGAEDWKKTTVLMKGTLSLLSSLNTGIILSDEGNYGKAVESLMAASVSASTVQSNSNLNNGDISGYARDIAANADKTTREVLMDEAKLFELRGWNIKKAVEHALAMNDISGLKNEENVLESAVSYQYAATLYGLLDDKEKRLENVYEESLLMDKHDELVSDAIDLRIKAENTLSTSKENDLSRIWGIYLLLNPYNYDTFSTSYKTAESYLEDASMKYKVAGELLLYDQTKEDLNNLKAERRYILSLFIIMCILYGVIFIYAITRVIGGAMAYFRDMYEREVGDMLIT